MARKTRRTDVRGANTLQREATVTQERQLWRRERKRRERRVIRPRIRHGVTPQWHHCQQPWRVKQKTAAPGEGKDGGKCSSGLVSCWTISRTVANARGGFKNIREVCINVLTVLQLFRLIGCCFCALPLTRFFFFFLFLFCFVFLYGTRGVWNFRREFSSLNSRVFVTRCNDR